MTHAITTELLAELIPAADREGRHVLVIFYGEHGEEIPPLMVDDVPEIDPINCAAFMDAVARLGVEGGATTAHLAICRPGSPDLTPEDHVWIEAVNNTNADPRTFETLRLASPLDFASLHLATPGQVVALI